MACHNISVLREPRGEPPHGGSQHMRSIDQCGLSMVKPAIVVKFTPLRAIHRSGIYIRKYSNIYIDGLKQ